MLPTFREYIFEICDKTDLKDEEAVVGAMQTLAKEAITNHDIAMDYEAKLKEVMSAKDYDEFMTKCGKQMYRNWVNSLPDSPFKTFALENEAKILMEEEDDERR